MSVDKLRQYKLSTSENILNLINNPRKILKYELGYTE